MAERIKERELPKHHDPETEFAIEHGPHQDEPQVKSTQGILAKARMQPGTDRLTVTPAMRQKYGIGENESVCWQRNPQVQAWAELTGNQSLDHWLNVMEGEVVTYDAGNGKRERVKTGDLILCKYPSSIDAEFKEIQQEKRDEYMINTREGDYRNLPRYRQTQEELDAMRDEALSGLPMSGLIGEWQGQAAENVMHNLGKERVKEIMREYRGSRMTEEDMNAARVEAHNAAVKEQGRGGSGGKIISIPGNVRPRNFAGAKK